MTVQFSIPNDIVSLKTHLFRSIISLTSEANALTSHPIRTEYSLKHLFHSVRIGEIFTGPGKVLNQALGENLSLNYKDVRLCLQKVLRSPILEAA